MALRITKTLAASGAAAVLAVGGLAFTAHQDGALTAHAQAASATPAAALMKGGGLKSVLDQLVGEGKLTSAQENDVLTGWQQYLQQHRPPRQPGAGLGRGAMRGDTQAIATALKLTPQQVQQQVRSGKSIAQIAQAQNVPLQTVEDAIVNATKTRLDKAVAAGRMTSAQETQFLNNLRARLPQWLNATPGQGRGARGPRPQASPTPAA